MATAVGFVVWLGLVHPAQFLPLFYFGSEVCAGIFIYLISREIDDDE